MPDTAFPSSFSHQHASFRHSNFSNERIGMIIHESIATKERLLASAMHDIAVCGHLLAERLDAGGKVLLCGNGGSAADAQHIAAELVIRYRGEVNRPALPALALTTDSSLLTAGANDFGYENVFGRAVQALGREGDVLVAISTSGNSPSIMRACEQARKQGIKIIGLLGSGGGQVLPLCDNAVIVPATKTARIQESHILVGHIWCEMIEELLFPEQCAALASR